MRRIPVHGKPHVRATAIGGQLFCGVMGVFKKYCWAMPVASFVVLPAFHGTSYDIACEEILSK